jgi:hypothetical protein
MTAAAIATTATVEAATSTRPFFHSCLGVKPIAAQLWSYCTGAVQAGVASMQASRLVPRRHSLVLRCAFGSQIVCTDRGVGSSDQARRGDPASGPTRPRRRPRLGVSSAPLATVQADRGADRRFRGRPPDRGSPLPPVSCPRRVLCLLRAARAIAVMSALVSIGRRNSRPCGPDGRRFVCPRGGGHRPRPVERHDEQAGTIEHLNRTPRDRQSTHRPARARRAVRPNLAPRPGRGLSLISASMS